MSKCFSSSAARVSRSFSSSKACFELGGASTGRIGIYDVAGRLVRTFDVDDPRGVVVWDGRGRHRRSVAPGVYFVRIETDRGGHSRRVLRMP